MYALHLLGSVALDGPSGPLSGYATQRRQLALLAMLAVAGREGASRDKLQACLWPNADADAARHSLADSVYRLRKELGADAIEGGPTTLRLNPGVVGCDVLAFEAALEAGDLAAAVREYAGPFLESFHVRDSVAFEHWREGEARRLERATEAALETLADRSESAGDVAAAANWLQRLLALDPYNSRTVLRLMTALAARGDPANAIRLAEEHRVFLASELDVEPPAELLKLAERLHRRGSTPWRIRRGKQPLPFEEHTRPRPAPHSPFVGREAELAQLRHHLEMALAGDGRIVFITGEAGTGKTTLAAEFCRQAAKTETDLVVASGNGNACTGIGDPYLPFREILGLLTGEVEARYVAGSMTRDQAIRLWDVAPATLETLADIAPDLIGTFISRAEMRQRVEQLTTDADDLAGLRRILGAAVRQDEQKPLPQAALFDQCCRLLERSARQQPLLLVLDDLQWADDGSIALLFQLGRHLQGQRILVLGLYRPADVALGRNGARHPLDPVVNELATRFGDIRIEVGREADRSFVDSLLDAEPNVLDAAFRDSLFGQTKGHALYTVELLRSFREQGILRRNERNEWAADKDLNWTIVPPRVEAAIGERIQRLSPELHQVLRVASVEGEEFTLEVVAAVLGSDARKLMPVVSMELEKRHRLVAAQGIRRVNGQRQSVCRFQHSLFQRYLYDGLDAVQRPDLHGRVAEALVTLYGDQDGELAVALAHHFREAGLDAETVKYLTLAGAWAKRTGAPLVSLACYRDALEILPRLPASTDRDRSETQVNLVLGFGITDSGGYVSPEAEGCYARAAELARRLADDATRVLANTGLYLVYQCRREIDRAFQVAEENLALVEQLGAPQLSLVAWDQFARIVAIHGDHWRAIRIEEDLLAGLEARPGSGEEVEYAGWDPMAILLTTVAMGNCKVGRPDRALAQGLRGAGMARQSADPANPSLALFYLTFVHLWRGEWVEALNTVSELAAVVERFGMDYYLPYVQCHQGWSAVERGDLEEGIGLLRAGIDRLYDCGSTISITCFMAVLAGALSRAGNLAEASTILERALQEEVTTGDLEHRAETVRQKGELLMARGDDAAAEAALREAITVAREQGALSFELRASSDLAELLGRGGRSDEARELLAAVYGQFTEGFETADLIRARALLDRL